MVKKITREELRGLIKEALDAHGVDDVTGAPLKPPSRHWFMFLCTGDEMDTCITQDPALATRMHMKPLALDVGGVGRLHDGGRLWKEIKTGTPLPRDRVNSGDFITVMPDREMFFMGNDGRARARRERAAR